MKQGLFSIVENCAIAKNTYRMVLQGDTSAVTNPGQFVNIAVDGQYLRRPISVCDCEGDTLTLIYKTVGEGTQKLSANRPGDALDILTGLGNGYSLECAGEAPLLIGGGVGVPPLFWLCRKLQQQGCKPTVILGFNSAEEVFYADEFAKFAQKVYITTADGSMGHKGFVTDVMKDLRYSYFYTCGPMPMFRAIERIAVGSGEYSFEERMGCGFGACMGCSCKTQFRDKRICTDGPVLKREEIIWETQA